MRARFASMAIAAISLSAAPTWGAELKVSGAATVANTVIVPNKAAIEREASLSLAITVNGDGNGLKDLTAGKSDVMMVAAPLEVTEELVNKTAPGSASAAGLQMRQIGSVPIRFIVNPANPVQSLTEAQVKDIFTGRITSWRDVGGQDQPIMVVAEQPGFGTRANIVSSLLGGSEITDKARLMQALVQVVQVVSQAPNAIGYGNAASITASVRVLPDIEVSQPIGFATRGAPTADAKRFIDVAAKYAKAN